MFCCCTPLRSAHIFELVTEKDEPCERIPQSRGFPLLRMSRCAISLTHPESPRQWNRFERNWSRPRIKTKGGNVMNEYRKPEVTVLGNAARLIEGSKLGRGESVNPLYSMAVDECAED